MTRARPRDQRHGKRPRGAASCRRRSPAFTLIELVVVIDWLKDRTSVRVP